MIDQNNDATISDTARQGCRRLGRFGRSHGKLEGRLNDRRNGWIERWWYERPGPKVSSDYAAIDPAVSVLGAGNGGAIYHRTAAQPYKANSYGAVLTGCRRK